MKKLLILIMALAMTLSLAACGGEADGETSPANQSGTSVADEQAKADADYAKLEGFFNRVIENYTSQQELTTLLEEVKSGQKEESALLDAYKKLAEDSNGMLQDVQSTTWETNYYDDKLAVLNECVEALALYQQTIYEASAENDATKLETVAALIDDYDTKLGALLDIMGVE
jgi:ABC-type glycerol-3-phosphate transport system substrate-binding protein